MGAATAAGTATRKREMATVYAAGLFQGIALVAFPAAAAQFTSDTGYGLSSAEYGVLFVPQVILAIAGSIAFPALARTIGIKTVLAVGLAADTFAMGMLVASVPVEGDAAAFPMLLVATGALGLGFGLTLSSLSTYAGAFMPDRREVALTGLNVLLGLGTALSPLLTALFTDLARWWYLPVLAGIGTVACLVATLLQPMRVPADGPRRGKLHIPRFFWVFAAALVLYGILETMFGNWGTTLLRDNGVGANAANYGLAAFWASVTLGRLIIALLPKRVPVLPIYLALPWAITAMLVVSPWADSAAMGIVFFALAGLACSGFFPMTVGYGEATFPSVVAVAAGWLIAAYQLGYGIAAFGAGSLQDIVSLGTVFRVAAGMAVVMGLLAIPIARAQRHPEHASRMHLHPTPAPRSAQ